MDYDRINWEDCAAASGDQAFNAILGGEPATGPGFEEVNVSFVNSCGPGTTGYVVYFVTVETAP